MAPQTSLDTYRRAVPEVWFRIIHLSVDHVKACAELREQTVEVGLGPDGAFDNSNIGRLTRRVPASQVVCAIPERTRRASRPRPAKKPRVASAAKFLRLAHEWQRQLDAGEVESQVAIARREGLTRARVSQIMSLLRLAREIQERALSRIHKQDSTNITERALRPIAQLRDRETQVIAFGDLVRQCKKLHREHTAGAPPQRPWMNTQHRAPRSTDSS